MHNRKYSFGKKYITIYLAIKTLPPLIRPPRFIFNNIMSMITMNPQELIDNNDYRFLCYYYEKNTNGNIDTNMLLTNYKPCSIININKKITTYKCAEIPALYLFIEYCLKKKETTLIRNIDKSDIFKSLAYMRNITNKEFKELFLKYYIEDVKVLYIFLIRKIAEVNIELINFILSIKDFNLNNIFSLPALKLSENEKTYIKKNINIKKN